MRTHAPALFALILLCACSKAPQAATPPAPAPAPTPTPAPAPAKPMKMVCRNSQTGAKVECGSPGAVMVGMQPE